MSPGNEAGPGRLTQGTANNHSTASKTTPTITGSVLIDLRGLGRLPDLDVVRRRLHSELEQTPGGANVDLMVGNVAPHDYHWQHVPTAHIRGIRILGEAHQVAAWIRVLRDEPPVDVWSVEYRNRYEPWVAS